MVPWTGSVPRRARHLIPAGLPRRREAVAACAVALLAAHLLLAQLTLVLAVLFAVVSKASRWRLWWLLVPAAAGTAWTLAIGPDKALAGFAAGPSAILWHLAGGHRAGAAGHRFAGFAEAGRWLPGQFPVALIAAAAEAALAGWLDWLHTDEWAVPPSRPGLLAAVRRRLTADTIRAGAVVTRDGCALGVLPSTGGVAELRWADLAAGALVTGAAPPDVTLAGLQVVHAALRRRKPVIVFDLGDPAVARAVAAACQATGVPLLPTDLPAVDLGRVVRDRTAVLVPADSGERAATACAGLSSLADGLRRIGVDGDALVWVPHGERVPARAIAPLLRDGPQAGLSVLIGTTSPAAAAELSGLTGTMLIFRVTDRDLAASLAPRTGTRVLPAPAAAALSRQSAGPGPGQATAPGPGAILAQLAPPGQLTVPGQGAVPVPEPDLVPGPLVPAAALLALGEAEFIVTATSPPRLAATARLVPARLPGRLR